MERSKIKASAAEGTPVFCSESSLISM
jgi:hypothetical protein